jgi:hypothetical protein
MNKIEKMKKSLKEANGEWGKLHNAICEFGLITDAGATTYGEEKAYMNKDRAELGVYQTPVQFASLLEEIATQPIKSYAEIGIFRGGTFLFMSTLLKLKNPKVKLLAIDPTSKQADTFIHPDALPYIEKYHHFGTSDDFKGKKFDLVFIDGDHSYDWLKRDYENMGQHAKICIIHDINEPSCPDVKRFWDELKPKLQGKKILQFTDSAGGVKTQGIGVIFS